MDLKASERVGPDVHVVGTLTFLERLFENDSDGLLAFDHELRLTLWSPRMEILTGLAGTAVVGRSVLDLFPSLIETGDSFYLNEALLGRYTIVPDRIFARAEQGAPGGNELYFSPLHGRDGAVLGGMAVVRNVRERLLTDQRLRETERRFRSMADQAPVLLWMSGTDARCDFFNHGWLDFTGRTIEQELGYGWAEGVHFEDFQVCVDEYLAAFNARRPFELVYRLRRGDGEFRWLLDRAAPRYTPDGEFAGYIGSCVDITDRKLAEDTLKRTADDLTRSNLELERFAHVASHDLQEPLRMVTNFTELLALKCRDSLDPEAQEYIRYAVDGARRMKDLIDGLLEFSRIGASAEGAFRTVDCETVLDEVLADLKLMIQETGAAVTREPLPAVRGDRVYLGQLFRNLIQNAIKFRGTEPPRIHVGVVRSGTVWTFSVKDNGIGFDMKFAERIFVIFQRLHQREAYAGNGVGLAICRRIVERHGGRIWAESSPLGGSAFLFTIPIDKR